MENNISSGEVRRNLDKTYPHLASPRSYRTPGHRNICI